MAGYGRPGVQPPVVNLTPTDGVRSDAFKIGASQTASYNAGAMQDWIDAASALGVPAILTAAGDLSYDTALVVAKSGLKIVSISPTGTRLVQTTAGQHGIDVQADAYGGSAFGAAGTAMVELANVTLQGPGAGTSTAHGINVDGATTYTGFLMSLRRVVAQGFAIGYYNRKADQCTLEDCVLSHNGVNLDVGSNANSVILLRTQIASATTIGAIFSGSYGLEIYGGDFGSQPIMMQVQSGAKVIMLGGNFESATNGIAAFVDVQQGGELQHLSPRFLMGSGADIPAYQVAGYATCHVERPVRNGFSTSPGMKLLSGAAVGTVTPRDNTGQFTGGFTIEDANAERYHSSAFYQRADNSIPPASAANRGMILHVVGRSGVAPDRLVMCMRDAAGTGYSWVTVGTA